MSLTKHREIYNATMESLQKYPEDHGFTYLLNGEMDIYTAFKEVNQINLSNPGLHFLLPVYRIDPSITQSFALYLNSDNSYEAGEAMLKEICAILSVLFRAPIGNVKIKEVIRLKTEPNTLYPASIRSQTIMGRATIRGSASERDIENIQNAFSAGLSSISESTKLVCDLYRQARTADDPLKIFWLYYQILLIIVGDRTPIEKHILKRKPTISKFHNHKYDKNFTVVTAVRDSFSHPLSYEAFDVDAQIRNANSALYEITSELLTETLTRKRRSRTGHAI